MVLLKWLTKPADWGSSGVALVFQTTKRKEITNTLKHWWPEISSLVRMHFKRNPVTTKPIIHQSSGCGNGNIILLYSPSNFRTFTLLLNLLFKFTIRCSTILYLRRTECHTSLRMSITILNDVFKTFQLISISVDWVKVNL